jgi:hypothetical protein
MSVRPALLRRLLHDDSGVALIEFAFSMPLLLTIGLMGAEVAHYGMANLRVSQIAMLTADSAGRVRDSIDEKDVNDLMIGAKKVGTGIDFADNGRIILSSIEPTSTGTYQWIRWQRCSGAKNIDSSYGFPLNSSGYAIKDTTSGTSETKSTMTAMGPTGNQIAASSGTAVMFVEAVYDYQPIVSSLWLGPRVIRYTAAYNVRQRTDQAIKNAASLTNAGKSACNVFTA